MYPVKSCVFFSKEEWLRGTTNNPHVSSTILGFHILVLAKNQEVSPLLFVRNVDLVKIQCQKGERVLKINI